MAAIIALPNWFIDKLRQKECPKKTSRSSRKPFMHGDDRPVILLNLLFAQSQPSDERNIKMSLNHRGADSLVPPWFWKCLRLEAGTELRLWLCAAAHCWSCLLINRERGGHDLGSEMRAERSGRVEIDEAAEQGGQFILLSKEHQAGMPPRRVVHAQIEIARGGEISAQDGAEEREPPDAAGAAKLRDFFHVHSNGQLDDFHAGLIARAARGGNDEARCFFRCHAR